MLLIMQFLQPYITSSLLGSNIPLGIPFSNRFNLYFPILWERPSFVPVQYKGQFIVLCILILVGLQSSVRTCSKYSANCFLAVWQYVSLYRWNGHIWYKFWSLLILAWLSVNFETVVYLLWLGLHVSERFSSCSCCTEYRYWQCLFLYFLIYFVFASI